MFGTSGDYHQFNAGAHRKRSNNFSAPAVTWHLGFWLKTPYSENIFQPDIDTIPDLVGDYDNTKREHKRIIDDFIMNICSIVTRSDVTSNLSISPNVNDKIILFSAIADPITFTILENDNIEDFLTDRQYDLFKTDNRVVSAKFQWFGIGMTVRFEIHAEYFTMTTYAELGNIGKITKDNVLENYRELSSFLADQLEEQTRGEPTSIRDFWFNRFWKEYLNFIICQDDIKRIYKNEVFGSVFADFRSIVISDDVVKFSDDEFFAGNKKPTWGVQAEKTIMPLVSPKELYECTTSYMLGGRAMYMTTLGPQRPQYRDDERIPLEYILYIHQRSPKDANKKIVNKWQAGRLVDRLHYLGTTRLASLKELPNLRMAGIALAGLDGLVAIARDSVEKDADDAIKHIENAHSYFNKITSDFNRSTSSSSGLLYRIERSRYYVKLFRSEASFLTLNRVGGHQKYDEFVEHRLGSAFDYVDRLGQRYERALESLLTLDQNYLAIKSYSSSEKLLDIQIWGEFILLAFLVPYYVVGLLDHIIVEKNFEIVAIVVWGMFLTPAVFRFLKAKNSKNKNSKTLWYYFVSMAVAVSMIAFWGLLHHLELLRLD